jgi:hypothetical protein
MKSSAVLLTLTLAVALVGCDRAQEKPAAKGDSKPAASDPGTAAKPAASTKDEPGPDTQGPANADKPGHGGDVIALGTAKLGAFEVRASRDKGEIRPGGDAPIDVWIDGGVGKGVVAVRFWIGAEDAKGSMRAKAEIEDGKWHTHVEVPSPMPTGSKLWVEVEESGSKKTLGSFDLRI